MALPAWLAVIEHVPTAASVTVTPETLQTGVLLEANVTVNPELAVALKAKGAVPTTRLLNAPNVIVWALLPDTVKVCVTGVAAA